MKETTALQLMPSPADWNQLKEVGAVALKSGLLPSAIKTPEQATIIALKGWELGLKPMVAFSHIHVVNGKPGCSAELLLAAIKSEYPKAVIKFKQMDAKACVIEARDNANDEPETFTFTIEEAQKAGLTSKDVWKNYAVDMLRARAITRMKRSKWPQVMMGLDHTPEELGAEITPNGTIKDVGPAPTPQGNVQVQTIAPKAPAQDAEDIDPPPAKEPPPPPAEKKPDEAARNALAKEIMAACKSRGFTLDDLSAEAEKQFGKKTLGLLTMDEMKKLKADLDQLPPQEKAV